MQRLVLDLDGTVRLDEPDVPYPRRRPNLPLAGQRRRGKAAGNMRTDQGNIGPIYARTLPVTSDRLNRHDIPFDRVHVGKPCCGTEGLHLDDHPSRAETHALTGQRG